MPKTLKVFVVCECDQIEKIINDMTIGDSSDRLAQFNQLIESGNWLIRTWVLANSGKVLLMLGGKIIFEVPASKVADLDDIRRRFNATTTKDLSIGVGMELSEANKALKVADLRGGDRTVLYTEDLEYELKESEKHRQHEDIVDKLVEERVEKAEAEGEYIDIEEQDLLKFGPELLTMPDDALTSLLSQRNSVGTARHRLIHPEAPIKPIATSGEHSSGEALNEVLNQAQENKPMAPEQTHAAGDIENFFHQIAQKQGEVDSTQKDKEIAGDMDSEGSGKLKERIVKVLTSFREQADFMEQLKTQNPELYKTMVEVVQTMVQLSKELSSQGTEQPFMEAVEKAEQIQKVLEDIEEEISGSSKIPGVLDKNLTPEGKPISLELNRDSYDYSHLLPPPPNPALADTFKYYRLFVHEGGDIKNFSSAPLFEAQIWHEGVPVGQISGHLHGDNHVVMSRPVFKTTINRNSGNALSEHQGRGLEDAMYQALSSHAKSRGFGTTVDDVAKEEPGGPKTIYPKHTYPIGTLKMPEGKMKVQHSDKTGWVEMRAGQIRSQDPGIEGEGGHPISARNPTGR